MRCPTEPQYRMLVMLASGSALLTGTKRKVEPLLRRGWVTADHDYAWVRITADGLRACALGVEKFGLPEMRAGTARRQVCSDCGRGWSPKCRCGSSTSRYEYREVERDAA